MTKSKTVPIVGGQKLPKDLTKAQIVGKISALTQKLDQLSGTLNMVVQTAVSTSQQVPNLQETIGEFINLLRMNQSSEVSKDGDFVLLDCIGYFVNQDGSRGEDFEGSHMLSTAIELSEAMETKYIPGFLKNFYNKSAGERFSFQVTFPLEYDAPELAGQLAEFDVLVVKVFTPVGNNFAIIEESQRLKTARDVERKEASATKAEAPAGTGK